MVKQMRSARRSCGVVLGMAVAAVLCLPGAALAHTGEFARFNQCPSKTEGVFKCMISVTNSGEILLGSKKTPIEHPVTLQGGISKENAEHVSSFFAASNGETLSKTPQAVPGGLLGIVPPEKSPALVKLLSKFFFENSLTGVNATLELAKPASEIQVSTFNLEIASGVALKLPVKVHLENPFLGSKCYVGSSSSPLIWNLTSGTSGTIEGKPGFPEFKEEFRITELTENTLVDATWSAPAAEGCGGILSFLVDPVIDTMIGLPSSSGNNKAVLNNTVWLATAVAVNNH